MKTVEGVDFQTISEVAKKLGVCISTIRNWEDYEKEIGYKCLPQPRRDLDRKGTRYYTVDAIEEFQKFRDSIEYGTIAIASRKKWGERGNDVK